MTDRHLVDVWNPSYASDSMEAHLRILLDQARLDDAGEVDEAALHVWWGKVRSPNRQQPLRHMDHILGLKAELDEDPERELHLYLTDYRSLYVADVEQIVLEDMSRAEPRHVPDWWMACRVWRQAEGAPPMPPPRREAEACRTSCVRG